MAPVSASRFFGEEVFAAQPTPPDYVPRNAIEFLLIHGYQRDIIVPQIHRAIAMAKLAWRDDMFWLYGESEQDLLRRQAARSEEAVRLQLEEEMKARLGRDSLSREEHLQIAELVAEKAGSKFEDVMSNLENWNDERAKVFAQTYMNVLKECLDEFLTGFDEAKAREIRLYLLEEAPDTEFASLQERAATEHGVQLEPRDILRESWSTRPEQTSGGDVRSVLRRVGEIDTSAEATSARLRRVTGTADAALEKAGSSVEGAHADEGAARQDPLRNWLRQAQARIRGADTDAAARATAGAIESAKRTVQAARGVTRDDAQTAAKEASSRARDAVRTSSFLQSSWEKTKETAGNLLRASKEAYVSRDSSALSEAAKKEADSATASLKSSQDRLRRTMDEQDSLLGRAKHWGLHATGLDRSPEQLAEEEAKDRESAASRREEWRGAAASWRRSALSSVRSQLKREPGEEAGSGATERPAEGGEKGKTEEGKDEESQGKG